MEQPLRNGRSKTLQEIYEEELELDAEAEAQKARNWGDENCCTYEKGYYRQPIYSCLDCAEKSGHQALFLCLSLLTEQVGVCYGCYLKCHLHHRTEEIFHKRHFRCDCGTPRLGNHCEVTNPKRDVDNAENQYSKNFKGIYCWCDDGYDPKYQFMFGCVMCENWFHKECVEQKEGPDGSIALVLDPVTKSVPADFVCEECYSKKPFLQYYSNLRVTTVNLEEYKKELAEKTLSEISVENVNTNPNEETENKDSTNNTTTITEPNSSTSTTTTCKLKELQQQQQASKPEPAEGSKDPNVHNTFWKVGWKRHLCECTECLDLYKQLQVSFLLEEKDLVDEIEEPEEEEEETEETEDANQPPKRKAVEISLNGPSTYDILEEQFLKSDKITLENKNNAITGLKQFTRLLEEFLKPKLQSESREVTAQDIEEFKEHLGIKKQKVSQ